ncbi:FAD/NAD(P)-binding protein [Pseudoduganella plicata]|uniref:Pyridine nucleotide-disulfide oxidoreductase n=1 Tax=Pseudoduganella plicata TaxID=321984 RepID=A0A4P7BHJ6_9BURK|nr:FAD/NAD(P)-binding protein [Pseudoduganella plicata]QBQ37085.1 hypothetical protein E1742_13570 [Pseudoduganella plicata]GGY99506.1 pyridine nucleotide-disulfide oxidoreductase [Pseudoduganella plicata]
MVITIVGGGATALAFLYNYIASVPSGQQPETTVYLVEKRGVFGPGAAYARDVSSNLLNTKTGFITPFHDRPGDFYNWLRENEWAWWRNFPAFDLHPDSYAPRPLFGMYLQAKMAWMVKHALTVNVRIIQVDAEVNDIAMVGNSCVARTNCSLTLTSDHVFLCCGTLPAKPAAFAGEVGRILPSPYPVAELPHRIAPDANVGIVGARLSCIDAVIGLVESGHRGPIAIHSRSGYFPCVRGTQGRIVPKFLEQGHLEALVRQKGRLRLTDIVDLVRQEIAHATQGDLPRDMPLPPAPPKDLAAYLEQEIELARSPRPWQAVLYSTNAVIDQLWMALRDSDKGLFLSDYFSAFMSYRVSIPTENAARILRYLKSGQLSFHAGEFAIEADGDGKPVIRTSSQAALGYDYLINATGSPRATKRLESTLLANLLQRGMAVEHPLGGIAVDRHNYEVIGRFPGKTRLHAMGELTTGTFFFTSALDINARHARNCATAFAASVFRQDSVGMEQAAAAG